MLTLLAVTVGGEEWRWLDAVDESPGILFVGAVLLVVYAARNRRVLMALSATLALPILVAVWPNWENTCVGNCDRYWCGPSATAAFGWSGPDVGGAENVRAARNGEPGVPSERCADTGKERLAIAAVAGAGLAILAVLVWERRAGSRRLAGLDAWTTLLVVGTLGGVAGVVLLPTRSAWANPVLAASFVCLASAFAMNVLDRFRR